MEEVSGENWGEVLKACSGAVYELLFRKVNPYGIFVTKKIAEIFEKIHTQHEKYHPFALSGTSGGKIELLLDLLVYATA